jgi:hypothetical protein
LTFTPRVSEGNRVRWPIFLATTWSSEIVFRNPPLAGCGAAVRNETSDEWLPSTSGWEIPAEDREIVPMVAELLQVGG